MPYAESAESMVGNDSRTSGVSWGAVVAGAFVSAALSLALLALGTGVGMSEVSPWANTGASGATVGWTAIIWLVLMQLIACSVGGYMAGRLRTKWVNVHTHEVFFRDTAHGFLVWAVGLVITAALLTSAATSLIGGAARASASVAENSRGGQSGEQGRNGYLVDTLLRPGSPTSAQSPGQANSTQGSSNQGNSSLHGEVGMIFANGLKEGSLPPADKSYLAQVVAANTGVSEPDAEKEVDSAFARAQQAAENARKAIAHSMYWTFLALLVGAFCASFAATVGGQQRDHVAVI